MIAGRHLRFLRDRYRWRGLIGDVSGGAIAAMIAMPYGLAMASLMGLPPALGLYTSILTAPITTALGRNPVLIGGTASATVPFIAEAVRQQGIGGAAKITIAASVFMMAFCVLRLGRYIVKVPPPVVSGFSCGVGAMMVISQLRTLLDLPASAVGASTNSLRQLAQVLAHADRARLPPLALGLVVIAGATLIARRSARLPAPLLGVVLAVGLSHLLGLRERALGELTLALPGFVGFSWTPADVSNLLPSAFGLAVIASVNLLITSRVVEHFRGRHTPMKRADADAELGAFGIANVCSGIFGAPMSIGIPARSLANIRCGGTTRLSNLLHAGFLTLFMTLGSGAIARVPIPALAGVIAYIGLCLLEWSTWYRLPRMRRVDAASFLVTALAVLCMNAVAAVALGCALHGARHLYARPSDADLLVRAVGAGKAK